MKPSDRISDICDELGVKGAKEKHQARMAHNATKLYLDEQYEKDEEKFNDLLGMVRVLDKTKMDAHVEALSTLITEFNKMAKGLIRGGVKKFTDSSAGAPELDVMGPAGVDGISEVKKVKPLRIKECCKTLARIVYHKNIDVRREGPMFWLNMRNAYPSMGGANHGMSEKAKFCPGCGEELKLMEADLK